MQSYSLVCKHFQAKLHFLIKLTLAVFSLPLLSLLARISAVVCAEFPSTVKPSLTGALYEGPLTFRGTACILLL